MFDVPSAVPLVEERLHLAVFECLLTLSPFKNNALSERKTNSRGLEENER